MTEIKVIRDNKFSTGFEIHGPRHEDGIIGKLNAGEKYPEWRLAQWGTYRNPLTDGVSRTESILIDMEGDYDIRLEMKSSKEYQGHLRRENEDWPHILIEQFFKNSVPRLSEVKKLEYTCEFRLDYCNNLIDQSLLDTVMHGAQVHQFFTVVDTRSSSYIWFGIPFFDTRHTIFPGYTGIDSGKDDASGMLILIEPQELFTSSSTHTHEWVSYKCDILPMIQNVFERAKENGYFKDSSLGDMRITSTNLGWEMFSEHDGAFEIRNLSLTAFCE